MKNHFEMNHYLNQLKNGFLTKDRDSLLESFLEFAELNKPLVLEAISKVNPNESDIFWNFIESVCDHSDEWADCILSEFSRLLSAADKMSNPTPIINSLEAFHILKNTSDNDFIEKMRDVIKRFLETGNSHLKRFLVWFLSYCMTGLDESDINLIKNLRFDEDVIVRYYAIISYNAFNGCPYDKGLSAIDKLVIDVSDVYVCENTF